MLELSLYINIVVSICNSNSNTQSKVSPYPTAHVDSIICQKSRAKMHASSIAQNATKQQYAIYREAPKRPAYFALTLSHSFQRTPCILSQRKKTKTVPITT